jgi:hypothetical protein
MAAAVPNANTVGVTSPNFALALAIMQKKKSNFFQNNASLLKEILDHVRGFITSVHCVLIGSFSTFTR